jgi:hypothetical protein
VYEWKEGVLLDEKALSRGKNGGEGWYGGNNLLCYKEHGGGGGKILLENNLHN